MKRNSRRGLTSVIGSVFVVVVTVSALAATFSIFQHQERAAVELAQETNKYLDSMSEKLEISHTRISNNKLNLTLSNDGGTAAQVKSIYIVNETASPNEQYRYDIDYLVDGRESVTNVGQQLALVASNTTSYSIKVVTESGNSASAVFLPLTLTALPLSLSVIPPTVTTGENVTLLYTISNNLTSSEPLTVNPTINSSVSCDAGQVCTATKLTSGPSEIDIQQGGFVVIKETYKIEGPPNTVVAFNASFTDAENGNYVVEKASVIVVYSTFGVNNGIATKPDIYLILPGPFGDSNQIGLWGTVVVNPTNSTMTVSRVLMTVFTAAHQGDVVIISGCTRDPIVPSTTSEWGCPHNHQIQWKDLVNPETLQPGESKSFLIRVQPNNLGVSEEPGATVTATVYTDIGVFTKAGYTTSMRDARTALANVYLTDTTSGSASTGALNEAHMFGHLNNLAPGTNTTFYISMTDFDTGTAGGTSQHTRINSGARLIIDVPLGFSNVTAANSNTGYSSNPTETVRADGITQIIATTSQHIGDSSSGEEARIVRFFAVTPSPTEDSTYIMYAFIDGTTNGSTTMSAGAIAEIALQVNGTG